MTGKMKLKLTADILMTMVLLMLMAYSLIGEALHEWLGIGIFLLFLFHQRLNAGWYRSLGKGRYSAYRILQTLLVLLMLCTMIGSMVSGIVLSQYALDFLPIRGGNDWARMLHLPCTYWSFVLMSLHFGLHWSMVVGLVRRRMGSGSPVRTALMRVLGALIAVCGAVSFSRHDLFSYLFLRTHFVFFDFDQPLALFFADYLSIMGMFVFLGYYGGKLLKMTGRIPAAGKEINL